MPKLTQILWASALTLTTPFTNTASASSEETVVDLAPRYVRQAPDIAFSDLEAHNLMQQESIITFDDQQWILSWVGQHTAPMGECYPNYTLSTCLFEDRGLLRQTKGPKFASYDIVAQHKRSGQKHQTAFRFYLMIPGTTGQADLDKRLMYVQDANGTYIGPNEI